MKLTEEKRRAGSGSVIQPYVPADPYENVTDPEYIRSYYDTIPPMDEGTLKTPFVHETTSQKEEKQSCILLSVDT